MRIRHLFVLLALLLFGANAAAAQVRGLKKVLQRKPPAEREERALVRAKALGNELYATDEEFRERVDAHYRIILQKHTDRAYRINTSPPSQVVVIREDRFRRHVGEDTLYDNLMIQSYVNRLGQRLVPEHSTSLFAFRIVVHPVPYAEALSTGTIYLSTGLISLLKNEAQLAYILAHEMAHVHLEHWKEKSKMIYGTAEYLERQDKKRAWKMLGAGLAGALIGSQIDDNQGGVIGFAIGAATVALLQPRLNLNWLVAEENEADSFAFEAIQNANYDIHEVKALYASLLDMTRWDLRVGLGFLAQPDRLNRRAEHTEKLIETALQTQASGDPYAELLIDTRRFKELMAELRRDNGIQALFRDMFYMAQENLRQAVEIRSNDPTALYYYGKVLELVGRSEEDLANAKKYFQLAADNDFRGWNFGAHLHYAMILLAETADETTVKQAGEKLQSYINSYSDYQLKEYAIRQLPAHLDTLYDYMALSGHAAWLPELPQVPEGIALRNIRAAQASER